MVNHSPSSISELWQKSYEIIGDCGTILNLKV